MTGSVRTWIPAAVVAVVIATLLGAAAAFGLRHPNSASAPAMRPSPDLHSPEAVMAAVRHYYEVEAKARKTGDGSLIDSVTTGPDSLASQNFKAFIAEQTAANRRSVILENHFDGWTISTTGDGATAIYSFWLRGHDLDAGSGQAVEVDSLTSKGRYRMHMQFARGRWLSSERQLLQDNVR